MTSYYDILGVAPTTTADDIKTAYRRLAMQFHPDRMPGATAEEQRLTEDKFKEVQEAYDTLRDAAKRADYDDLLTMLRSEEYYQPASKPAPPRDAVPCETPPRGARSKLRFPSALSRVLLLPALAGAVAGVLSHGLGGQISGANLLVSSFLIAGAPIVLWICIVKARMKWPLPAFFPSVAMLLLALVALMLGKSAIKPARAGQINRLAAPTTEAEAATRVRSTQPADRSAAALEGYGVVNGVLADSRGVQAIIDRGDALRDAGDFDAAIATYRQAWRARPLDSGLHSRLGWALEQKGDLDGAAAEYGAAIGLNPNDSSSQAGLTRVRAKLMVRQPPAKPPANHE